MESLSGILRPGASIYFVGIKGTGVCALAELIHGMGVKTRGSDTNEVFYTDGILKELGIPFHETFDPAHITGNIDLVIHSAAYSVENNAELAEAARKNIPLMSYPQALGAYSAAFDSAGIAGVHGKTTTTAMAGCLVRALELPGQVLAGSAVANFGGRSTLARGDTFFIAETCEYRRHFLLFHPKRIVLTAVESDHQDYFPTYESIRDAFVEYCRLLPSCGELIYCADDPGASEVAGIIESENRAVTLVPYGFSASGDYHISSYRVENERAFFRVNAFSLELALPVPGRHQALNAAAAIALASILLKKESAGSVHSHKSEFMQFAVKKALEEFKGAKRRSEIVGSACGILFMDDYGHHPTAIKTTLEGLRDFFPARRLVVSFMSHTYTRTAALLDEFAASLAEADVLFLHKIYASAREHFDGHIDGRSIMEKIKSLPTKKAELHYTDEPMDAFEQLKEILKPGDLFLTLGAGSNWPLGVELLKHFAGVSK
ncbi:MAG: UDP-N-acetylmuramate--L-alanine ligase [Treponema sp.]|jgi:UDP-N-acetylmuramate--alanine ligase|nr:UDP-N-acetylmuramate--L-alanine ligase [Treponema sp.]